MAAKTYFCYGIPVTNESITLATMAYEQVDGPFRFFRLVQRRVREGTFQTSRTSAVGALPIELWDLVRQNIINVELCAAERKFLDTHACPHCVSPDGCPTCGAPGAKKWEDLLRRTVCREVLNNYVGFDVIALTKVRRQQMISHVHEMKPFIPLQKCRALLHNYGLDMPSTHTLKSSQMQDWQLVDGDPGSVAFIAVSPSSPPDSADADDYVSYEEPDVDEDEFFRNDGIWPVSLKKPADANQRFRRLLREWHLTPLKVGDGTIGIARATDPERKRTYKRISADTVKPRWHLVTTIDRYCSCRIAFEIACACSCTSPVIPRPIKLSLAVSHLYTSASLSARLHAPTPVDIRVSLTPPYRSTA